MVRELGNAVRIVVLVLVGLTAAGTGAVDAQVVVPVAQTRLQLQIGREDRPDEALTVPIGVVTSPRSGAIYVSQPADRLIRVFNSDGKFLRTIGRSGQGPGEFSSLGPIGWLGDTLYAVDYGNQRVNLFRESGTSAGSLPLSGFGFAPEARGAFALLRDKSVLAVGRMTTRDILLKRPYQLFRVSPDLKQTSQLVSSSAPVSDVVMDGFIARFAFLEEEFGLTDRIVASPAGGSFAIIRSIIATDGARATISVTRLDVPGDTAYSVSIQDRAVKVTAQTKDSVVKVIMKDIPPRVFGTDNPAMKMDSALRISAFHALVSGAVHGADDRVWLKLRSDGKNVWTVIDSRGRISSKVQLPPKSELMFADATAFWVMISDQDDVPRLFRYGIQP